MTLYEISEQYRQLLENIEIDENGEMLNIEELEEAEGQLKEKLEATALYVKELKAMAESIKVEMVALKERADAKIKRAESLSRYMGSIMQSHEMKEFGSSKVRLSFRKSDAVIIDNEFMIPKNYLKETTTVTPDKVAIKKSLKFGEAIPGAHLEERENLQIK